MSKLISIVQYNNNTLLKEVKSTFALLKQNRKNPRVLDRHRVTGSINEFSFKSTKEFVSMFESNKFFVEFIYA
jgi:hypothetical protein